MLPKPTRLDIDSSWLALFQLEANCFYDTVKVRFGLDGPARIPLTVSNPGIDIER